MKEIKKMLKRTVGNLLVLALVFSMFAGVTLVSADTALALTDITVNGNGVYGFESSKLSYTVDVPYTYTPNNFAVAMPVISATANDPEADVDIDYPDTVNGGIATVTVSDDSQSVVYSLTLNPVGVNKYANPGFEESSEGWTATYVELTSEEKYAGNKSAKIKGTSTVQQTLFYQTVKNLTANRKYIASWAVKMNNNLGTGWTDKLLQPYRYEHNAYVTDGVYLMDGSKSEDQFFNASSDVGNGWRRNMVVFPNDYEHNMSLFTYSSYAQSAYTLWIDDAYMSELIVADVDITSSESWVEIPESGETTVQLTAELKNQFGNGAGLEDVTGISWRVVGEPQGVTINENGLLTITSDAASETIKVEASVALGDGFVQSGATGRINIGVSSAGAANLADIVVNGNGIYGFDSSKLNYIVDVPYTYTSNDFSVDMPVITAKAANPDATVEITHPDNVNGGVAKIAVTSADGYQTMEYNLTLRPVGVNKYANPGFEDGATGWGGNIVTNGNKYEIINDDTYAGTNSAVIQGPRTVDSTSFVQGLTGLSTDKKYIASWALKADFYPTDDNKCWLESGIYAYDFQPHQSSKTYLADGTLVQSNLIDANYKVEGTDWRRQMTVFTPNANGISQFMYKTDVSTLSYDLYIDDAYMSELIVADVDITSSDDDGFVTIPATESTTVNLTGKLLNQFGNGAGLENETITWKVIGSPEGVSINGGVVTVAPNAKSGVITVEASVALGDDFVQDGATGRIDIVLKPENIVKEVSYENSEGTTIEDIIAGTVTPRLTFTNDTLQDVKLKVYTAVYSKTGESLKLSSVKESDITLGAYETFAGALKAVSVPDSTGYIVKSFVWTGNHTPLMVSTPLE